MRTRLVHSIITILLTILFGGLLAATLVRYAPGFGVDEREFDARLSEESIRHIREESRQFSQGMPVYYLRYMTRVIAGDFGVSMSFRRPIAELISERFPETARSLGGGLACGWALGMLVAFAAAAIGRPSFDIVTSAAAAVFLCLPSSVLALILMLAGRWEGRSATAGVIGVVIFPRVFRYARAILTKVFTSPHVLMARAKGVGRLRLTWTHVLRPATPALVALLGTCVTVAFGASIPIEVICDSPGLGQLAWQAALKRDLPLLIDITLIVSLLAGISGIAADIGRPRLPAEEN
jgi:peptide/nickel transport system permease protein